MGARVLVVEDNAANLELMTYLLTAFGHQPEVARDGQQGVEMIMRGSFDVVICDIQLPKLDGFEVAQAIRQRDGPAVPLLAVTAFAQVGDRERVLGAGFDGYISKPIVPETFVQQVEAFLPAERRGSLAAAAAAHAPAVEPTLRQDRGAILVVDDEPQNVELLRSLLEPFGYRVTPAAGVAAGIRLLGEGDFDLIVSDVHLGDGTGFDLLEAVRSQPGLSGVPFVFLATTVRGSEPAARARSLGANGFIVRPIESAALLSRLEACLRGR
jgi:CheY-like chemotaxis protein